VSAILVTSLKERRKQGGKGGEEKILQIFSNISPPFLLPLPVLSLSLVIDNRARAT
jgi:hypothetical protein